MSRGFTADEIARMTPAIREEIQDWLMRAHNARVRRARWQPPAPEVTTRWSNGPCVYCGKNDGFTEVRKVGAVHLDRCHAAAAMRARLRVVREDTCDIRL
jgi:hypothetical protein